MKEIPLTQGYVALVDDEDYEELSKRNWQVSRSSNGKTMYAKTRITSTKQIRMHQFLTGKLDIDHKDRNGLNNQKYNLRKATRSQQVANSGPRTTNKSGFKGVSWHPCGKWRAVIMVGAKHKHLGLFLQKEEAAKAYDSAALQTFGEFAKLNYTIPA